MWMFLLGLFVGLAILALVAVVAFFVLGKALGGAFSSIWK